MRYLQYAAVASKWGEKIGNCIVINKLYGIEVNEGVRSFTVWFDCK